MALSGDHLPPTVQYTRTYIPHTYLTAYIIVIYYLCLEKFGLTFLTVDFDA